MMEQVRLCAVWPTENWLGFSLNLILGWTTVRESYSRALEQGPLSPILSSQKHGIIRCCCMLLLLRWGVVSENKSEKGCWTSVRSALSITVPFCQRGKVVSFTRIGPFLPAAAKLFRRYSNCWFLVLVLIQRVSEGHGDALET